MIFLKITPEGEFSYINVDREDLLQTCYREIGCSIIETVRLVSLGGYLMIVDECGLLKEDPKLNALPWHWYSYRHPSFPIVGTVLIGREDLVDGEPDVVGLYDYDVEFFKDWEFVAKATLYNR